MSVEDQFDVAAQDRRAEAAKKARTAPPYVYDRDAVIEAAKLAGKLEALADEIEAEALAAEQAEAEVPEVPGKVDQEPELPGEPAVAPPDPTTPAPPTLGEVSGG